MVGDFSHVGRVKPSGVPYDESPDSIPTKLRYPNFSDSNLTSIPHVTEKYECYHCDSPSKHGAFVYV